VSELDLDAISAELYYAGEAIQHFALKNPSGVSAHRIAERLLADAKRYRQQIEELTRERDTARAELKAVKGNRLVSAIFGQQEGARPFSLYRPGTQGQGLVALGAEFPDGAVALRLANDGGWTTVSKGGAEQFRHDGIEIVWLSEDLGSLAEMEQQLDDFRAERDSLLALKTAAKAWRNAGQLRDGDGLDFEEVMAAIERTDKALRAAVDALPEEPTS